MAVPFCSRTVTCCSLLISRLYTRATSWIPSRSCWTSSATRPRSPCPAPNTTSTRPARRARRSSSRKSHLMPGAHVNGNVVQRLVHKGQFHNIFQSNFRTTHLFIVFGGCNHATTIFQEDVGKATFLFLKLYLMLENSRLTFFRHSPSLYFLSRHVVDFQTVISLKNGCWRSRWALFSPRRLSSCQLADKNLRGMMTTNSQELK